MALSQRCFSAQPAFPWGNACMGSLEGKNPTSTPPGQGRIAPGCFDLERSAPLGWDQGQTRGPDGSRGRGGNPSPPPAPLPAVLQAAGSGLALPIPPANTPPSPGHGQASILGHPKQSQDSGSPSRLLPASSPPCAQLHPAGLQPNPRNDDRERQHQAPDTRAQGSPRSPGTRRMVRTERGRYTQG